MNIQTAIEKLEAGVITATVWINENNYNRIIKVAVDGNRMGKGEQKRFLQMIGVQSILSDYTSEVRAMISTLPEDATVSHILLERAKAKLVAVEKESTNIGGYKSNEENDAIFGEGNW